MQASGTPRPPRRTVRSRGGSGVLAGLTALACLVAVLVQAPGRPPQQGPERPRAIQVELASRQDPQPTTLLSVVPGDGRVTLNWAPGADNVGFGAYGVWVDGSWDHDVDARSGATSDTFSQLSDGTPLANGVEHEFAVTVVTYTDEPDGSRNWHESALSNRIRDAAGDYPPAAPATPSATAAEAATTVTWARSSEPDVAQYVVLRTGGGETGVEVGRVPQPASGGLTFVDRTGVRGERYSYAVTAVDARGHTSPASASSRTVTARNFYYPGAPAGLSADPHHQSVTLSWTLGSEADLKEYRVSRDGAVIGVVTVPGRTFTDTGLVNGRQYTYDVRSVDYGGNTSLTSSSVLATPFDDSPPSTPTGLTATAGDGQVVVTWTGNPESDLAGYDLFRDGVRAAGAVLGAGVTSYTDTGLVADRTYSYTLRARDTNGNPSPTSAPASATPYDRTAPAVPARPSATAGDGSVSLSWTANRETDLASYQVLRDGVVIATVARRTLTYTDRSVSNGTSYGYALAAVDTHDNASAASAPPVSATPVDRTPPAAPAGLTAARGDGRVTLSWTAGTEPDLASYQVLRDGVLVGTAPSAATPGFVDTGLTNDTTYAYSLVARDTSGNSSPESSPRASATPTDLTAPAAPRSVTYTPGDTVVDLAWQANSEPDLAAYRVYRDGHLVATVAVVAPPGTTPTSYRDTGLTNGVQHRFAVAAVDTHGNESVRATDAATPVDATAPDAPTALSAAPGDRRVVLTWTAGASTDVVTHRVLRDGLEVATVQAPGASFTDTGLANGRAYTYAVVAVDDSGNRSASTASAATTTATPRDSTPPAAPTAVSATAGDGTATVRWTAPTDVDLAGFVVRRADGTVLATVPAGTSTVDLTGLANGTAVTLEVVALDSSGNASPASARVTVTPAAPVTPTGPVVPPQGAGQSGTLAVSGDGRWLVIATSAALEASDTDRAPDLYRVDTTGTSAPRRLGPAGADRATADLQASDAAVSADGRYVAVATKDALALTDTNGLSDVYRGDLSTTPTTWALVSVPVSGAVSTTAGALVPTGSSTTAPAVAMSADGTRVAFYSKAALVPADTDTSADLYVKDLTSTDPARGPVTRASTAAGGTALGRTAVGPALALTPDGRYALFTATGPDGPVVAVRKDLGTTSGTAASSAGPAVLVSTSPPSTGSYFVGVDTGPGDLALSDDGRYAAFSTVNKITTSSPGTAWGLPLAYRKDLVTGDVVAVGTGKTNRWEHRVTLSPDGRYAAFLTDARGVSTDGNGHTDAYRRDLSAPASDPLVLVTSDATGAFRPFPTSPATPTEQDEHGRVVLLANGTAVVVTVLPLLGGDANAKRDVYVKDLTTGAVTSPLAPLL